MRKAMVMALVLSGCYGATVFDDDNGPCFAMEGVFVYEVAPTVALENDMCRPLVPEEVVITIGPGVSCGQQYDEHTWVGEHEQAVTYYAGQDGPEERSLVFVTDFQICTYDLVEP